MKKLLFFVTIILIFFNTAKVKADVFSGNIAKSQLDFATAFNHTGTNNNWVTEVFELTEETTVTDVEILMRNADPDYLNEGGSTSAGTLDLVIYDVPLTGAICQSTNLFDAFWGDAVNGFTDDAKVYDFTFAGCVLQPEVEYQLFINVTTSSNFFVYGTDTEPVDLQGCYIYSAGTPCGDVTSMYFKIIKEGEAFTVNYNFAPVIDGKSMNDFSNWTLQASWDNTSGRSFGAKVLWGQPFPSDFENPSQPTFLTNGFITSIAKTPTSSPQFYGAKIALYEFANGTTTLLSTGATSNFQIVAGDRTGFAVPLETETEVSIASCGETDWQVVGVDFGRGLCNVFRFLFVPSDFSTDRWSTLMSDAQTRMPFVMFYEFKDSFAAASSTASTTLAFTYNASSSPITGINIPLKATLVGFIGETTFNFIYTLMGIGVCFLLAVYTFYRIKNLM